MADQHESVTPVRAAGLAVAVLAWALAMFIAYDQGHHGWAIFMLVVAATFGWAVWTGEPVIKITTRPRSDRADDA